MKALAAYMDFCFMLSSADVTLIFKRMKHWGNLKKNGPFIVEIMRISPLFTDCGDGGTPTGQFR